MALPLGATLETYGGFSYCHSDWEHCQSWVSEGQQVVHGAAWQQLANALPVMCMDKKATYNALNLTILYKITKFFLYFSCTLNAAMCIINRKKIALYFIWSLTKLCSPFWKVILPVATLLQYLKHQNKISLYLPLPESRWCYVTASYVLNCSCIKCFIVSHFPSISYQ